MVDSLFVEVSLHPPDDAMVIKLEDTVWNLHSSRLKTPLLMAPIRSIKKVVPSTIVAIMNTDAIPAMNVIP